MKHPKDKPTRGPMIHVRLEDSVHYELKMMTVEKRTSIQELVSDLIRKAVQKHNKSAKRR